MTDHSWVREFPGAVTVMDTEGTILEMNDKAAAVFAADGGAKLIGRSGIDCHPEPARSKLRAMLERPSSNVYTIEKGGVRKLIYQSPWFDGGRFSGIVELSIEIPAAMPHFKRD